MKQMGMLVVSLRGVNFGFWSRLGYSGQSANILSRQGLAYGSVKKHRIIIYAKRNRSQIFFLTCFVYRIRGQNLLKPPPDWSPFGVTKSLSHAQMVSFRGFIWESPPPRRFCSQLKVFLLLHFYWGLSLG